MATVEELKQAQNASTNTTTTAPSTGVANSYSTQGADKINAMYDAQKESQLNQLKSAYDQSKSEYTAAQEKIAPQYQSAANALGVQNERNKRNMNLQAAANGINTGTASQMALAQNNVAQREYGKLRTAEADAQAEAARQLANFEAKYQSDVAAAIANNDYQRAAALYDEFKNAQNMDLKNAQILAEFGDFSGYSRLYGEDQAKNMFYIWAAQNPDLALNAGRITAAQRDNLVNGKPINEGLDANGNRVGSIASGGYSGGNAWESWQYDPTLGAGWENSSLNPANNFSAVSPTGQIISGLSESAANAMQQEFNKR
jgi:hypothetical protein